MLKISELPSDQAFEVMAKLVPYIYSLSDDDEIRDVKNERNAARSSGDADAGQKVTERYFTTVMPLLLTKHRDDVFGIVAVLNEKTVDDVRKMPYAKLMECINGAGIFDIIDFFRFAVRVTASI